LYDPSNTVVFQFWASHINNIKNCWTAAASGCWDLPNQGTVTINGINSSTQSGMKLANGANLILGARDTVNGYQDILIDYNGSGAPNTEGEDQIYLRLCIGPTPTNACGSGWAAGNRDVVGAINSAGNSATLYKQIFQ
jgi:hypothetical protein